MAKFEKSFQDYLDSLSDEELLGYLMLRWTEIIPIWERCSKEEYDKHVPNMDGPLTPQKLANLLAYLHDLFDYRRIPIWHNGGGIMDQISGKEPDGYYYEKKVGEKKCIMVGEAMKDYIIKRGLIEKFKNLKK